MFCVTFIRILFKFDNNPCLCLCSFSGYFQSFYNNSMWWSIFFVCVFYMTEELWMKFSSLRICGTSYYIFGLNCAVLISFIYFIIYFVLYHSKILQFWYLLHLVQGSGWCCGKMLVNFFRWSYTWAHGQYTMKNGFFMVVLPLAVQCILLLHFGFVLLLFLCVFCFGCPLHNWHRCYLCKHGFVLLLFWVSYLCNIILNEIVESSINNWRD